MEGDWSVLEEDYYTVLVPRNFVNLNPCFERDNFYIEVRY